MENATDHPPSRLSRTGTACRELGRLVRDIPPLVWVGVTLLILSAVVGPGGSAQPTLETYSTSRGLSHTEAFAFSVGIQGGLVLASIMCLLSWAVTAWLRRADATVRARPR